MALLFDATDVSNGIALKAALAWQLDVFHLLVTHNF